MISLLVAVLQNIPSTGMHSHTLTSVAAAVETQGYCAQRLKKNFLPYKVRPIRSQLLQTWVSSALPNA
jgi:hypothetical protein